jgi:poly-gamma-glutamate capsule biosynthesis protein CapA/YwtB (metallophosphatase superfamily)
MDDRVKVAVVGDLFPNGRFLNKEQPLSSTFESTLDALSAADLRIGNFLMPLSERGVPMEKLSNIRAHPDIANDVAALQLDIASIANNHICDYGPLALLDTISALAGIGVTVVGAGDSIGVANRPVTLSRNQLRIGVLAYSCLVPPGAAATSERSGIAAIRVSSSYTVNAQWAIEEPGEPEMVNIRTWTDSDDQERAEEHVRALKSEVDVLLLSLHWGYGASDNLAEYQVPLGHALIDAGADAILGHHVHAVQGVEIYRGKPILYSSGTFLGRQVPEDPGNLSELGARLIAAMSPDGFLALLTLDRSGVSELDILPSTLSDNGLPILANTEAVKRVEARVRRLSQPFGTRFETLTDRIKVCL